MRAAIGVTGQFSAVDNLLTGEENLQLMADLRHLGRAAGRRRVAELLDRFELTDAARKPLSAYSGGMRRRLDLAMTLVGDPRLIFLDEPTTGLDPRSRRTMWQIIRELVADGVTIFLTTQYLDEADQLADRMAVLDHGRIVAEGTPDELKRRIPGGHVQLQFADPHELSAAAALLPAATPDPDQLSLQVSVTAASPRCVTCSTSSPRPASAPSGCQSTRRTWMTCSSPSPGTPPAPSARKRPSYDRHSQLHPHRFGDDAAPQPQAPAALPVADADAGRHAHPVPAAVRVRLRRAARRRTRRAVGTHPDRHAYLTYIVPGILIMTVASAALGTAISVAMDMTQGIIDRFRTMAIARGAVLTGHVIGTLMQTLAVLVLVVGVPWRWASVRRPARSTGWPQPAY